MRETDPEKSRRTSDAGRRATRLVLLVFGLLAVYFTGVFPPWSNPNELSRFETVVAMGEWKTFSIDQAIAQLGDHEDKAEYGGRLYSNKGPGLAFAAYPVYQLLRVVLPAPRRATSDAIFVFLRLLTVSTICVLALQRFAARLAAAQSGAAVSALVTLAVGMGTPFLYYARSFFSHAWTASLLFLAWDLACRSEDSRSRAPLRLVAAAGFLAGWAVIAEYPVAPIVLLLCIRVGARRALGRSGAFAAAAAIPLAVLLAYNAICFGSPWTLSSAREASPVYAELVSRGAFGFQLPSPRIALAYLFDPARGVLLFSPFLAWSVAGLVRWWRSGRDRADWWFVVAAISALFVSLSGYPNWHGGWCLGSRYLLPAVFFAALPLSHSLRSPMSRGLFVAATTYSVANHIVLTSSFAHFAPDMPWPAATGAIWFLARGWFAPNLGAMLGFGMWASLLLAAGLVALALVLAARAARPTRPAVSVALLLGAAVLIAVLLRSPDPPWTGRLWRAAMLGAYSSRDPARIELLTVAAEAVTPEEKRLAVKTWLFYGPPREAPPQTPTTR